MARGASLDEVEAAVLRAAADPDAWQEAMERLAAALPGARTHLLGYDVALRRNLPEAQWGYAPDYLDSYRAHYGGVNPYIPNWTRLPVGRVVFSDEVVEQPALVRSEYYADWLRPQADLRCGHVAVLARDAGRMFMLGTHIERRAEPRLVERVGAAMARLVPLMRHALEVNRMTLGLRIDALLLRAGAEPEGAAALLVGRSGTILFANGPAEALLAAGAAIRCDPRGRLAFADPGAALRLDAALRAGPGAGGEAFRLADGGWEVRLLSVPDDALARLRLPPHLRTAPPALLVAMAPPRGAADEVLRLMRRLRLTRAEAEVALAVSDGLTLAEVAERRRASLHTVREQVKAAMGKAEARHRAAFVRAILEHRRAR